MKRKVLEKGKERKFRWNEMVENPHLAVLLGGCTWGTVGTVHS